MDILWNYLPEAINIHNICFHGEIRKIFTKYSILSETISLGPVVQSVISLTSSLRVISLTVLVDSIDNILIFFAEKM